MDRERAVELKAQFSDMWVDFAKQHQEEMLLMDWLEVFGVLSATVVMNSTCPAEEAQEVFEQMGEFAYEVYETQAEKFLTNVQ